MSLIILFTQKYSSFFFRIIYTFLRFLYKLHIFQHIIPIIFVCFYSKRNRQAVTLPDDFCLYEFGIQRNCSVPSQLRVKMHSKSPSVMAFCLVCLGILAKKMPKHLAGYYLLNNYDSTILI